MKSKIMLGLIVSCCVLGACSKKADSGNAAVDGEGNCTSATVEAYNDLTTKNYMFSILMNNSSRQDLKSSCETLQSLLGGTSCKAENLKTGGERMVSYGDVKSACDNASQALPVAIPPKSTENLPTSPKVSQWPPVSSTENVYKNGILLQVKNEDVMNSLLQTEKTVSMQDGKAIDSSSVNFVEQFCEFARVVTEKKVARGSTLKFVTTVSDEVSVEFEDKEDGLRMRCFGLTPPANWSATDLQDVFADTALVTIQK